MNQFFPFYLSILNLSIIFLNSFEIIFFLLKNITNRNDGKTGEKKKKKKKKIYPPKKLQQKKITKKISHITHQKKKQGFSIITILFIYRILLNLLNCIVLSVGK